MSRIKSERYSRDYSNGELALALKFYNITRKFSQEKLPVIEDVSLVTEENIDWFLRTAKESGFDVYGTRLKRMFEQQVIDTDLHGDKPKVYTSYYGNVPVLDLFNVVKVRIALYAPKYQKAHQNCPSLAPSKELLSDIKNDIIGPPEYTVRYEQEISKLDAAKVYQELIALGNGRDVAILCYEKPPDFCHRHIAANWFKDELGIELIEFPFK